jgi:hypothetical protein
VYPEVLFFLVYWLGESSLTDKPRATHLYVQVVGHHAAQPERLLIRSDDGRWYVWFGDRRGTPLREIDEPIADWLQHQPDLTILPEPHFWLHVDDLPMVAINIEEEIHQRTEEAQ